VTLVQAATAESYLFPGEELTRLQRCALRATLRGWADDQMVARKMLSRDFGSRHRGNLGSILKNAAREPMRDELNQDYGSIVAMWLLFTVAGAAISFIVEKILARLFPDKQGYGMNRELFNRMNEWSGANAG
jgi:hypothetical protein